MKRPVKTLLLALAVTVADGAALVTAVAQAPAPQTPSTGLIAGRVIDPAGMAVADAVVVLTPTATQGTTPATRPNVGSPVVSDSQGRFAFNGLGPGAYQVEAAKPGWLTGGSGRRRPGGLSTPVAIAESERKNDLSITIWRAAVIAGRVLDDRGEPLIGAEVRAIRRIYIAGRPQSDTPIRAKTDDLGAYRFSRLAPGEYIVAVLMSVLSEPPGLAVAISGSGTPRPYLQTMSGLATAPVTFERATGVVGSGQPLFGSLSDSLAAPPVDGPWLAYATTFHPSATSITSAAAIVVRAGDLKEDANITTKLTPTFQVSGVVSDDKGPAALHAIHLIPADAGDTPLMDVSTAVSDAKGAFTFYGVPRGQYIARIVRTPWPNAPGQQLGVTGGTGQIPRISISGRAGAGPAGPIEPLMHASAPVSVTDRNVRGLVVTMTAGPQVRGFAQFEGKSAQPDLSRVAVLIEPAGGREDQNLPQSLFASDGRFASTGAFPGQYLVRANAPSGWTFKGAFYQGRDISDTPIDLTADIDNVVIIFTDETHKLTGSVTAANGLPSASAVLLFPTDTTSWTDYGRTSRRITSTQPSGSGAFSLPLPPPGEYFVIAIADDDAEGWQNPSQLKRLATLAERVRVGAGPLVVPSLPVKRLR